MNTPTFSEALEALKKSFLEGQDENSTYYVWQSNIACAFVDAAQKYFESEGSYLMTQHDLHKISNEAAKNFLNRVCEPDPKTIS